MWIIGGGGSDNSIWNSIDGENWEKIREGNSIAPPFTYCTAVVYQNKMWIIGGTGTPGAWYSTDGVKWKRACNDRIVPSEDVSAVVSPDNKLWIFGGCGKKTGVWYTTDSPY
jgi:N-acetylneuraminic acid mutarotase